MFARLERSWNLVKFSVSILKKDKELLVFPILSSVAAMLVLASFFPLLLADITMADPAYSDPAYSGSDNSPISYPLLFVIYLCEYFVVFFFNSALVAAALERIHGGDPTVSSGLKVAWRKVGVIFFYSMIAATVGTILRFIGERGGLFGRLFAGLSGMLWTLASFLAVPVLVSRNIGPIDALKESLSLMRRTWGENIIVNAGMGIVFTIVYFVLGITMVGLLVMTAAPDSAGVTITLGSIFLVVFVLLGLVHATLQGIFSAALYHYAVDGEDDAGIPAEVMGSAFSQK
jgi:hypothetical protein